MSAVPSILNQTGFDSGTGKKNQVAEDKEMFLKLLVTQLSNQDPLNPVEDKEFVTQLAQFTSLEELQKINGGIDNMVEQSNTDRLVGAVSFVGKRVMASGNNVAVRYYEDGSMEVDPIFFTNDVEMKTCTATVVNKENGTVLWAEQLGSQAVGDHPYQWTGRDYNGKLVPAGSYEVMISGTDMEDQGVLVKSEMVGNVIMVENDKGTYKLMLEDGRTVNFTDVTLVGNRVAAAASTSTTTPGS